VNGKEALIKLTLTNLERYRSMSRTGLLPEHEQALQEEVNQWLKRRYPMDFNSYQRVAKTTAIYPATHKVIYPALGLAGEAGEVANKVKKLIRDGTSSLPKDWKEQIASEIGDCLWYCANLAEDLGISLGRIAAENETKLAKRKKKGTIGGSGDTR
jgi:NTP pyrophosphatase (non-canonical NTP hydrolase)